MACAQDVGAGVDTGANKRANKRARPAGAVGLGLDAGGTHTRWALADAAGRVVASGEVPAMSGQQLASSAGHQALTAALQQLARDLANHPKPHALVAGITGFDAQALPQWQTLAAAALALPAARVHAQSDIELACAAAFAPGAGMVLMAGTGAIAAHLDTQGVLHRAGGRGAVIDDAGGGHWIARQALQHIWRAEDAAPGSWRASPLACQVFAQMGGSSWAHTRQWVYGATRGELGTLALAVALAAGHDPVAAALLVQAGQELARLVLVLQHRLGVQPVALGGRVFDLHPLIENSLRQALPQGLPVQRMQTPAHHAAARLAVGMANATLPRQWPV